MTKQPAELIRDRSRREELRVRRGRLLLRPRLCGLWLRRRLGAALDRCQAPGCEGIDSGALSPRIVDNRHPVAARIVRQIDVVRCTNTAHDIAFGMTERDCSRC